MNGGDRRASSASTCSDARRLGTVLSPTGDRIVGKRQTGARAEIVGDPHRRIWEQHDESLEAFEKRVEAEAEALHQTRSGD
jgi:hypothetical protein